MPENSTVDGTFLGCTVTLKGAKKAPNGKALLVTNFHSILYRASANTVDLIDTVTGKNYYNVSLNCIDDVLKKVKDYPSWIDPELYKTEVK